MRTATILSLLSLSLIQLISITSVTHASPAGEVTARPCPHSCQTMGLKKKRCRDWREGDTCYVEDLTRSARPTTAPRPPAAAASGCDGISRADVAPPYITLTKEKPSGGMFSQKVRVEGEIEGRCLQEAGIYEDGRLKFPIPVVTTSEFRRFAFNERVDGDDRPEVRAYTVFGDRAREPIFANE